MNPNSECLPISALKKDASQTHAPPVTVPAARRSKAPLGWILLGTLVLVGAGLYAGMKPRLEKREEVAAVTHDLSRLTVGVVKPAPATASVPMLFSGELKPLTEASIYARASGFVRTWKADLGTQVKAGDLLAELDTPELDSSLSQARAVLVQAEAARELATMTAVRWKKLLADKAVSTQEVDEKKADADLKKAAVDAARADVQRLEELRSFARITAPFDGTVIARSLDVGQLVTAGGSSELYRVAQTNMLRVFVRVPQSYARAVEVGQSTALTVPELPGRTFEGKVARTAAAIDPASRTLLTEIEVNNTKGELLAGSYAQVRLTAANDEAALTVPSNTVLFRAEGSQLAVVDDSSHVSLRQVKLGRDFGTNIEIRSGIKLGERIVINPPDSLVEGLEVRAVDMDADKEKKKN